MKPTQFALIAVSAFLWITIARAVDLDDPGGVSKSTVRTELYRGTLATAECDIGTEYVSLMLAKCVYGIHTDNVNKRTATKPFTLGLFFDAWLRAAANVKGEQIQAPEGVARDFFFYFEAHRRDLGLSLSQVCEAARRPCDRVEPLWKDWNETLQKPR